MLSCQPIGWKLHCLVNNFSADSATILQAYDAKPARLRLRSKFWLRDLNIPRHCDCCHQLEQKKTQLQQPTCLCVHLGIQCKNIPKPLAALTVVTSFLQHCTVTHSANYLHYGTPLVRRHHGHYGSVCFNLSCVSQITMTRVRHQRPTTSVHLAGSFVLGHVLLAMGLFAQTLIRCSIVFKPVLMTSTVPLLSGVDETRTACYIT